MSSQWSRLFSKPTGAIPGGIFGQIAVGLTTVMIAAFLISYAIQGGSTEEQALVAPEEKTLAGERIQQQVDRGIEEQQRIEQLRRAAQARDHLRAQRQQAEQVRRARQSGPGRRSPRMAGLASAPAAMGQGQGGGDAIDTMIEAELAEQELLQELKLQSIRRKHESLRSNPVAQSVRPAPGQASPGPVARAAQPQRRPGSPSGPGAQDIHNLLQATENLIELENQGASQAGASPQAGIGSPAGMAAAVVNQPTARDLLNPATVTAPADPEGFERIHEGSFLEGALVTQLSGEFPGPVLAQVSVPFYSQDRQRVLIPRGSRLIGSAQAVSNRDQGRLAIGFHRLILPDGRWVSLRFEGLDQVGTTALKDRVNRHYIQMFAAAGAVGILSGLTLRGSNPYGGGVEGFRAGAGQGFGQGATQIMQRFLNRLPTITIRAGHRLRIWFTGDVLVPRPEAA